MPRPLRLLLVTQYFHPEVGATQTRMWQFAKHLVRLGHEVTVVCEFPNHPHGVIPPEYDGRWFERDRLEGFDIIRVRVKTSSEKNFRTRLLFYLSFMGMGVIGGMTVRGGIDAVIGPECSSACEVECGYSCVEDINVLSTFTSACGNGVVDADFN